MYEAVRELMMESSDIGATVVGIDFTGKEIDKAKLADERKVLKERSLDEKVILYYDEKKLWEIRKRQDFV